ncbi:MAG TPA: alpha/beta hydrolase [Burkholderiales bacterium]|nr:alpha/beta hydrolase [Burkholderiales bacterium]
MFLGACAATSPAPPVPPTQPVFTAADGARLPMRVFPAAGRPRAVVIALHGFNDYSGFFEESAGYFARAGITTLAYDQRGFGASPGRGRWPGEAALVDDFLAFAREARRRHPGVPLYALGESMGGAVVALGLAREPALPVDGAILVTPAIWSRDTMPWYQRFGMWLGSSLTPGVRLNSADFDIPPTDNPEAREAFARDPLTIKGTRFDTMDALTGLMGEAMRAVPQVRTRTLFLYGLQDVMIPRAPMVALFERWPAAPAPNFRFALYPDGHHLLLRDRQRAAVWRDIVSWIERPDAPLPSGFQRDRAEVLRLLRAAPS